MEHFTDWGEVFDEMFGGDLEKTFNDNFFTLDVKKMQKDNDNNLYELKKSPKGDLQMFEVPLAGYEKRNIDIHYNRDTGILHIEAERKDGQFSIQDSHSEKIDIGSGKTFKEVKYVNGMLKFYLIPEGHNDNSGKGEKINIK